MALHRGWDLEAVPENRHSDDADSPGDVSVPSSWTAINQPPSGQLLSPRPSASQDRQRNSAVAQYLGPDADASSTLSFAPTLAPRTPKSQHELTRKKPDSVNKTKNNGLASKNHLEQRLVSDGLRATKPASGQRLTPEDTQNNLSVGLSKKRITEATSHSDVSQSLPTAYSSQETTWATSDAGIDDILRSIDFDKNSTNHCPTNDQADAFDDGLEDADLLALNTDLTNNFSNANDHYRGRPYSSDAPTAVSDLADPNSSPGTFGLGNTRGPSSQFISPVTRTTRIRAQDGESKHNMKPIVRPPFPSQVRDRSPIIGLSPNTLLRTCFRIGEAINAGRHAVKDGKNVILELHARVLTSRRDEIKQHFVFCDLYHTNPPYIKAVYDAAIWKSVELFNYDSGRLLQENKTCRCIGKMKRDGKEWVLVVLNIWETTWEDISWVEGIVNA